MRRLCLQVVGIAVAAAIACVATPASAQQGNAPPASGAAEVVSSPSPDPAFHVSGFLFSGNESIATAELEELVAGDAGRPMTLAELEAVVRRVTDYYRRRGFLVAQAYLPPQEITGGKVQIHVLEGVYGEIETRGDASLRPGVVEAHLRGIRSGEPVEVRSLARAVLLLSDLPGVDVEGTLRAGRAPGTTDLVVTLTDGARFSGSVTVDNHGGQGGGAVRGIVNLNWNNPLSDGGRLSLSALTTGPWRRYGRIAYESPVNRSELRLRATYAVSEYVLGDEFSALDPSGSSRSLSLTASYPLVRSVERNVIASLDYSRTHLADDVAGTILSERQLDAGTAVVFDERALASGGRLAYQVSLRAGNLRFLSDSAAALDAATANAAGGYGRVRASLALERPWGVRTRFGASLDGQWASKNLDPSEKFSLGGPEGVRAYPVGEAAGDDGWLARVSLRRSLGLPGWLAGLHGGALEGFAALDAGGVTVNKTSWPGAGGADTQGLLGGALGVSWSRGPFSTELVYAHPLGDDAAGAGGGRWWVQGAWRF